MNILNIIKDQLSPEILGQLSKSVGENPDGTKSALQSALPALLGSAAAQASSPGGATGLLEMLKQKTPQGGWSDTLSGLLGSTGSAGAASGLGSSFVSSLLGPKMNAVRDFIAGRSGIRSESATSLMSTGGQLLMGILGKQVMARGLGASGLGQLLSSQIPHLQGMVPPEMANMLGIGNLLGTGKQAVSDAASQAAPVLEHAGRSGASALRWAIPLAVVLGAILLIYQHNNRRNVGGTADETTRAVDRSAATAGASAQAFTEQMKAAIGKADGAPVALQGVDFDSSGNLSAEAQAKLSQLGTLINQNPSLRVTITTYGNGVEEATTKAKAIETALVRTGLGAERITTKPEVGQGVPKISFAK